MNPPDFIQSWFTSMKISPSWGMIITTAIVSLVVLLISFVAFYIARRIVRTLVARFIERTTTTLDNILIEKNLLNRLTLLVPVLVVQFFIPMIFVEYPHIEAFVGRAVNLYFIVVVVLVLDVLITILHSFYQALKMAREIPLTGLFQVVKIVLYFVGIIFVVSVIFNKAPVFLFSGLGAMTAVLMLIFKDPILGFVAGIQLITNRMLKQGDWIEMPKYGADGDVIDITLTTVKVRNWDKTITTIPTYALISDSFKNWRGMQESGGRRIKRAINIDMNSIRFCTPKMLERFVKI